MLSTVVRFALVGAVLIAAGCAERGFVTIDPAAARVGAVEPIYVATSRTASEGADIFGRERSKVLGFARFDVAVPPDREPGTLNFPEALPADPRTDFLTVEAARFPDDRAFLAAVNAGLAGAAGAGAAALRLRARVQHQLRRGDLSPGADAARLRHAGAGRPLRLAVGGGRAALPLRPRQRVLRPRRAGAAAQAPRRERRRADRRSSRIRWGRRSSLEALRQMALVGAPRFFDKLNAVALLVARRGRGPLPQRGRAARHDGHSLVHLRVEPRPGAARLLVPARAEGAARLAGRSRRARRRST